jgi:hypothetical protein
VTRIEFLIEYDDAGDYCVDEPPIYAAPLQGHSGEIW